MIAHLVDSFACLVFVYTILSRMHSGKHACSNKYKELIVFKNNSLHKGRDDNMKQNIVSKIIYM